MAYSIQDYLDSIGWDGAKDMYGRDARAISFDIRSSGIDGGDFGYDESVLGTFFDDMNPGSTVPTGNNMQADGRQQGAVETAATNYTSQLNDMYNNLLGRDVGSEGVQYWSGQLEGGSSLQDVAAAIRSGDEFQARNRLVQMYNSELGRNPTEAELDAIVNPGGTGIDWNSINLGGDDGTTTTTPTGPTGPAADWAAGNIRGIIHQQFQNLYGRYPTAGEMSYLRGLGLTYDQFMNGQYTLPGDDTTTTDDGTTTTDDGTTTTDDGTTTDNPTTGGGGGGDGGGGYVWNWDQFGAPSLDGGGGYDPSDFTFDVYVPGQESPWGIPDVEGGNTDFYRNQFVNLLAQEQGFRQKQQAAAMRREEAAQNPSQGINGDWSWIEGGLPEVEVGGPPTSWQLANGITEGMTNRNVLNQLSGQLDPQTVDFYEMQWGDNQPGADQAWWTQKTSPTDLLGAYGNETNQYARDSQRDLANTLFRGNTNPAVPTGYAAPRPGMRPGGYERGGAEFVYDPVSGAYQPTGGGGTAFGGGRLTTGGAAGGRAV